MVLVPRVLPTVLQYLAALVLRILNVVPVYLGLRYKQERIVQNLQCQHIVLQAVSRFSLAELGDSRIATQEQKC